MLRHVNLFNFVLLTVNICLIYRLSFQNPHAAEPQSQSRFHNLILTTVKEPFLISRATVMFDARPRSYDSCTSLTAAATGAGVGVHRKTGSSR